MSAHRPRSTVKKMAKEPERVSDVGGLVALNIERLVGGAMAMVVASTAAEATGFDTCAWLGEWLEQSNPALGGARPSQLLHTRSGYLAVKRALGAIQSGAYL